MARIDKPVIFQDARPGRSGGEPWREFKSSLAVNFTSKRRPVWKPNELGDEVRSQIIRSIEARDTVAAAQMRLKTAMRELVQKAIGPQVLGSDSPGWMLPGDDLPKVARQIASESEALRALRPELLQLLGRIEENAPMAALLSNGFLEVREERSGEVTMSFSLGRRITLDLFEAEREARRLRHFLRNATAVLDRAAHDINRVEPRRQS